MDGFKDSTKMTFTHKALGGPVHKTSGLLPLKVAPPRAEPMAGLIHRAKGGAVARGNRVQAEEAGEDAVIDRSRPQNIKPRFATAKVYKDPDAKSEKSELAVKLTSKAKPGYSSEPLISRAAGALGFKKGGKV